MTLANSPQFKRFDDYLAVDQSDLPDGRFDDWDGEWVSVRPESLGNGTIAPVFRVSLLRNKTHRLRIRDI